MATELRGEVVLNEDGEWYWEIVGLEFKPGCYGIEATQSAAMDAAREAIRKEQERGA